MLFNGGRQVTGVVICVLVVFSTSTRSDEARVAVDGSLNNKLGKFHSSESTGNSPVMMALSSGSHESSSSSSSSPSSKDGTHGNSESEGGHGDKRYQVASVDFHHVSAPYIISIWIIIAGLAKIGFHVTPKLHLICPESCVLLLIGVIIGLLLFFTGLSSVGPLTPDVFFLYMLPPIVLDAGYFMPNRLFFDNLVTILLYAVIGTVWNALAIGLSLWAVGLTGLYSKELPLLHTLLFSSIISAVDPVAVLAVFEEVHVNEVLYIIVFGESLLNDAVTVVLYHMFEGYAEMGLENILPVDYVAGVASFFVVALGGTFVGIVWGLFAAFISRFTHHVLVIEPLFVFVMAYLSYLTAELFHLSGIMALTFCGITMKNYVEENVSHKSHVTVKYTMKMLASSSETIIFVLLGVSTVNDKHEWNTWFVVLTVVFCSIYRAIGVLLLTAFANRFRLHQFDKVEQFIMSYGGLRGAVAFALALIIDENVIPSKDMMVTTVISVVYFTVFVQGMTIGFLVNILKVAKSSKTSISMNERFHSTVIDHLMAGIEGISDHLLGNNKIRDKFKYYNNRYIRPFLTRNAKVQEPKILQTCSKLNLTDAMNLVKSNSTLMPIINPEAGISLSTMFKSYTQANLCRLAPDEVPSPTGPAPPLLNVDIGELSYSPSFKDLADAEIHHILEDSMFKPQKRTRRYSRSEIYEPEPKHPPFHHHMRMQIRRLMSESRRRRARKSNHNSFNGRPPFVVDDNAQRKSPVNTIFYSTNAKHPHVQVTTASESLTTTIEEPEEPEDEGIIFFANREASPPSSNEDSDVASTSQTVAEVTLPWKREDVPQGANAICRQNEFPTWVDNKDYYMGYLSPTNTFLEGINPSSPVNRRPSVFEVFSSVDTIPESMDENEEAQTSENVPSSSIKPPEEEHSSELPGSTSREPYKSPLENRTSVDIPGAPESASITQHTKDTNLSHAKSPDRFSVTPITSDVSRNRGSADTVSIECPDVAVDMDSEGSDTKL